MSLSKERNTPAMEGGLLELPAAANAKVYAGGIGVVNASGYATKGSAATTLKAVGRIEESVDNTGGADGATTIKIRRGVFKFKNSATDAVTRASIMGDCYIEDDETVAATAGDPVSKSKAGKVISIDSDGVWVEIK